MKKEVVPVYKKQAAWSGYSEPYVKNIISGASKVLTLLATLTFDMTLLNWVKGLQKHLEMRIKEADEEQKRIKDLYNMPHRSK